MDRLITWVLKIIGFVSYKLPIRARVSLGIFLGFILRKLSKQREKITEENLKNAFPEKSSDEINLIVRKSYHNLGIVLAEVPAMKYMTEQDFRKCIEFENIELVQEVYGRGKGLILLSGHFGNWEYVAYTAGLYSKIPILIVVKPQKNKLADKILNNYRTKANNQVVSMFSAARGIIKAISEKKVIALIVDQSASPDKDIFVDFFGRPATTYEAPAALALKFDVPIIIGLGVRQSNGTYKVRVDEIKHDDLENTPDGIRKLTERHVKYLEDHIRKNPDHWAWQHKRWKYRV
jgi:KDO2-lipid IV(A) lauroyltransferase